MPWRVWLAAMSSTIWLASSMILPPTMWYTYQARIALPPGAIEAADLHLTAALPVARYVEFLTPSPYLDELITTPFRPDADGYLHVPMLPGLGVELNREALKRYGI
jgi:L-alanine-DL-glutamate epimerase-like enolase superfamily enzyme